MVFTKQYEVVAVDATLSNKMSVVAKPKRRWFHSLCCCYQTTRTYPLSNFIYHVATGAFVRVTFSKKNEPIVLIFSVTDTEMRDQLATNLPAGIVHSH